MAMNEPTVGAGYARGVFDLAIKLGADRAQLALKAGIDPAVLDDHDARMPLSDYLALMKAGKALSGDPALALKVGEAFDLSELSVLGLICHASPTMLDAFRQMNRYGQLVVEARQIDDRDRFELRRRDGALWLVDNRILPPGFTELVETSFALMVCGTRPFGDTPFVHEVQLAYPDPGYADDYARVFRAPVVFGAEWNAMRIDEAWLTHSIAVQPRYTFGILCGHAEKLLTQIEQARTVRTRVQSLLLPLLHTGDAGMEPVLRQMGVSRQTLYRQLRAEGTTFLAVLDDLRSELALHYLAASKVSVNETAYLVGFSDPAAFSRAFKRWTGEAPGQARSRLARSVAC